MPLDAHPSAAPRGVEARSALGTYALGFDSTGLAGATSAEIVLVGLPAPSPAYDR